MRTHLADLAASSSAPVLLAVIILGLVSVYLAGRRWTLAEEPSRDGSSAAPGSVHGLNTEVELPR
ncbi:hypothetical protein ABZ916_24170 [Streptomyces sp. NPDC046853]|uniref:hypothetical protein n=1 Tax=Streptomyces sp. NPDC046853 TaxID=3154920 RepID=UPI0033E83BBF